MKTLIMTLAGPMQSWGLGSAFEQRNTQYEPTKSGVIGLICAALGRERDEPLQELTALRMGVRCDQPGLLQYEFQTALKVARASTGTGAQLSRRAYLADAKFVVGLEGDESLLQQVLHALLNPVWPLFLGRKSYLPSQPVVSPKGAIVSLALEDALLKHPLNKGNIEQYKTVVEGAQNADSFQEKRADVPVTFEHGKRQFTERLVTISWNKVPQKGDANVLL